jgi:hypothetical protein
MSKTFKGVEMSLGPGGVYPKNSATEVIERRRIAGEEAIQSISRQKVLAQESGKKGPLAKGKNTERFNDALRRAYAAWKARLVHRGRCPAFYVPSRRCTCIPDAPNSKKSVNQFIVEIRKHLPNELRFYKKRLTRDGKGFMSARRIKDIVLHIEPLAK